MSDWKAKLLNCVPKKKITSQCQIMNHASHCNKQPNEKLKYRYLGFSYYLNSYFKWWKWSFCICVSVGFVYIHIHTIYTYTHKLYAVGY